MFKKENFIPILNTTFLNILIEKRIIKDYESSSNEEKKQIRDILQENIQKFAKKRITELNRDIEKIKHAKERKFDPNKLINQLINGDGKKFLFHEILFYNEKHRNFFGDELKTIKNIFENGFIPINLFADSLHQRKSNEKYKSNDSFKELPFHSNFTKLEKLNHKGFKPFYGGYNGFICELPDDDYFITQKVFEGWREKFPLETLFENYKNKKLPLANPQFLQSLLIYKFSGDKYHIATFMGLKPSKIKAYISHNFNSEENSSELKKLCLENNIIFIKKEPQNIYNTEIKIDNRKFKLTFFFKDRGKIKKREEKNITFFK